MADENWQKVREIFDSVLRRPPEERRDYLIEACGGDQALQHEVESLLSSLESAENFLETPVVANVADVFKAETKTLEKDTSFSYYKIIEKIGAGGMGEVYLASDTRLERKVALKLLSANITEDKARVSRFRQEAFATSALNHPNIVTIYEIGEWQGRDFIAAEFVEGMTLRSVLRKKKLSTGEALDVALQIASALAAAHKAGIVHRDIKPENVMIREDGLVKVLDFGIAKYRPTEKGRRPIVETEIGEIIGTAAYMSPEQARGLDVDAQTDIWSLGVILYEMLARRLPFEGKTKSDRIAAILEHEPVPLTKINRKVLPELEQIVSRALAKDKKARYAEMAEMAEDLYLLRETTGDKHAAPFILPVRKSPVFRSPYLFAALALAVLLIGAAALGIYLFDTGKSSVADKKSLAVLPLQPVNTANRDEIYEIGIADSLIHRLSSMKGFIVRPLSAVRKYAVTGQDPLAAGREQQVDYVLASNYQLSGERIRITSQLLNVRTGQIEETYKSEKDAGDIFVMQDAVAAEMGNFLLARFATTSGSPVTKRGTANEEAYRLYLQGMYLADRRSLADAQKATAVLERAVNLDPAYAQAWAGKAYAHRVVANFTGRRTNLHEDHRKSMDAVNKTLELDANLAEAHSTLCENKMYYEYDFSTAEGACKRAVELNPDSSQAHQIYSRFLFSRKRFDEAIAEIKTAIDLEPASLFNHTLYGINFYYARRYPEAVAQFKRVLAMDENFGIARGWLVITLAVQGNEAEAFEIFINEMILAGADEAAVQVYRKAFQTSGWQGVMRERVKVFEQGDEIYFRGAEYYIQAGNKAKALELLENSYQRREMWMAYLQVDPRLDPLRSEPRFEELVRRVESK